MSKLNSFWHAITKDPLSLPDRVYYPMIHAVRPNLVRHTFQVTSVGGVGTTFLCNFARKVGCNTFNRFDPGEFRNDNGAWKHMRVPINPTDHPDIRLRRNYRVLYVIGNPCDSVISLFRRKFHIYALDRVQVSSESKLAFNPRWTLEDYIENGHDLYEIEDHVRNWTERYCNLPYPVMVVKYEAIFTHKDKILDFMEVPRSSRSLFPKQRERASDVKKLDSRHRAMLESMYAPTVAYISTLPDYYIR